MAAEVKAGEVYNVERPMNRDNWSMFRVKDKGSEIAVFIGENMGLQDGERVKIKRIVSTKNTSRPLKDKQGNPVMDADGKQKWVPSVTANVEIERDSGSWTEEMGDEGDLPF